MALRPASGRLAPLGRAARSPRASHALIRLQYTLPVEYGRSRPSTANSIASSRVASPSAGSPLVDEHPAERLEGFGLEIGRAQPPAELDDFAGRRRARSRSPRPVGRLGLAQAEGAVLGRLRIVLERSAGPAQPTAGDGGPGLEAVVLLEPDRALARRAAVPELVEARVRRLAGVDALVETAEPPGRVGQPSRRSAASSGSVRPERATRRVVRARPVTACERGIAAGARAVVAHRVPALRRHEDRR